MLWGTQLWIGSKDRVAAEIFYHEPDGVKLVARCMRTGKLLWEYVHHRPPLAIWAEEKLAWPGAPQEEIYVFLARSETSLVLCVHRRTRCVGMSSYEFSELATPPFQCQTDLYSFEPTSGDIRWSTVQHGLAVEYSRMKDFLGPWVNGEQAGWLDLRFGSSEHHRKKWLLFRYANCFWTGRLFPLVRQEKQTHRLHSNKQTYGSGWRVQLE